MILVMRGAQHPSYLSVELNVSTATATRVADRLVRKGLAEKHLDDGRAVLVMLSPDGQSLVKQLMDQRREAFVGIFRKLTLKQQRDLTHAFNAFAAVADAGESMLGLGRRDVPFLAGSPVIAGIEAGERPRPVVYLPGVAAEPEPLAPHPVSGTHPQAICCGRDQPSRVVTRARLGELVSGVPQVVKMNAFQADSGQTIRLGRRDLADAL